MNRKLTICAWLGIVAMTLLFLGLWPSWHMFPPTAPTLTPDEIAAFFHEHQTGMLVGGVLQSFGLALLFVFVGGLTACLKKMEGAFSPLTDAFIMITPFGYFTIFATIIFFMAAAYRPDLSAETIRLLTDLGLLMLVFPAAPGVVMFVVSGFIILGDRNPTPIFPRWTGYLSIWVGILSAPGCCVAFFKTGPFAWNGILAFWMPTIVFGIAINIFFWAMLRAAKHPALADA